MKLLIKFLCLILLLSGITYAQYDVANPNSYSYKDSENEKVLFILDFSASMTEKLEGKSKLFMMLDTMHKILPKINPKTYVGLRVYGHRMGFTQFDACRASSLQVPIKENSSQEISQALTKLKPRGMTPITYSLRRAVDVDFLNFTGKKRIILLTDGGENCDESPCVWAMDLITKRNDIVIDVIAFNIDDEDDLDQLKCTSLVTTGKFYNAKTSADLVNSMSKSLNIKKEVDAKILIND